MTLTLVLGGLLIWMWAAVKTWSFVSADVSDRDGKSSVALGFFAGLAWPATYVVLMLGLMVGVLSGTSLRRACRALKLKWNN